MRSDSLFWRSLGAKVKVFSPKVHDEAVANISHLPHLLSYSLCNAVSPRDLKLAGSGFKDTTRIAKSDPQMWLSIFFQNRKNLLSSIRAFEENLSLLKSYIKTNKKAPLLKRLSTAQKKRKIMKKVPVIKMMNLVKKRMKKLMKRKKKQILVCLQ